MDRDKRRTLKEWMEIKKLTSNDLMGNGAGVSSAALDRWAKTGEIPLEVTGPGRCLHVADALSVAPELLDCGLFRRGMSEGKYRLVLYTHGTDSTGWEAYVESWGWAQDEGRVPPTELLHRFNRGQRVKGATAEASLDALDAELRDLIRTHPGTRPARHEPGSK